MHILWQRLEQFFAAQQWPVALRPGATEAEIAAVEAALGLPPGCVAARFPGDGERRGIALACPPVHARGGRARR